MEEKNTTKSTSKLNIFEIPVHKYEGDMERGPVKEKKKDILDIFINHNHLRSKEEFEEIEVNLHEACKEGDIELIKIYLSEKIENDSKDLTFKIDKTNKTASLFSANYDIKELIIPRTVTHESTDYLVTSISGNILFAQTIIFFEDSAVKTIYRNALFHSDIEKIYFPESLKELKKGWCNKANRLKNIIISPSNDKFIFKDDNYLLCKSDESEDEFDTFLFARRDIDKISIPSNIKIISSYAFDNCENLTKIEIPKNSNLQTIESNAFLCSSIKEIYFPANLKELREGWCRGTEKLTKIIISPSNGKFIFKDDNYLLCKSDESENEFDTFLFARRDIDKISIPSNIKIISSYAFEYCKYLTKVEIPMNSNLQTIEEYAFSRSNIEEIFIPSNVSKICEYAFHNCENLLKVEFSENSNLQTIEKSAFSYSKIIEFFVPQKVSKIGESAFEYCHALIKIEIPTDSNLQTVDEYAFSYTNIEEIYLPANLKELKKGWFNGTKKLTKIIVSPLNDKFIFKDDQYLLYKSEDEFDTFLFVRRDIKEFSIPSNIKTISSYAFEYCDDLIKVEIPMNSNLQTIEHRAFSESPKIKQIFIPSNVSKRCKYEYNDYKNLIKVEIPANNKKSGTSTKKELSTVPHVDIPIDCSVILSLSIFKFYMTIITKDYKAIECQDFKTKYFEEYIIEDNAKQSYFPISCFLGFFYDLYMVSKVKKGIKTKLVKNRHFLNIGNFNPVAIFGGMHNCAAIDLKGAILYIPESFDEKSSKLIEPKYLPNDEKAVDIACLNDYLYVLSSKGRLYMSKKANTFNIVFKQVEQFKNINIIQISGYSSHVLALTEKGKVYSQGINGYGELGTGDKISHFKKFYEISSLNRYKITAVSAGDDHSLFLTSDGKILACGSNYSNQCFYTNLSDDYETVLPVETPFQRGAKFCISSDDSSAVCTGFDPEMSPNRRVKNDINILLFGSKKKTQILKAFVNNNFENSLNDDQDEEDYIVNLEINKKLIKLILIDAKNTNDSDERNIYYHRAMNLIYFFDDSNQTSSSFNVLNQIYEEANQVWDNDIKLVFVNCSNSKSSTPKIKLDEISQKYKCEIFDVDFDNNIENINKPFFSFLPDVYEHRNDILKIGKEYRNPFNDINKDHINIGIFGSKNVNKTDLAFRYIYGDIYKHFYDDFINNFADNSLSKTVEFINNYFDVSILDSTFVNNNDDNFRSCYSVVQGIVFVFKADLLSSSDFINEIDQFYKNAKDSVGDKLNLVIAFKVSENDQLNDLYQSLFDRINKIEKMFNSEVFLYSIESGENVEDLFYFLIKKIIQNKNQKKVSLKRKHHKKKKDKAKK